MFNFSTIDKEIKKIDYNPFNYIKCNYSEKKIIGIRRRGIDEFNQFEENKQFIYWKPKTLNIHQKYKIFSSNNWDKTKYCDYTELTKLKDEIKKKNWKLIEIEPNENCLYHCFEHYLKTQQKESLKMMNIYYKYNDKQTLNVLSNKYQLNVKIYEYNNNQG